MDIDYKESINQIFELHEHGTECEINKSLSALQSLGIQLTRDVLCWFFDILSNRMVETCRKIQIAYISSMENVEVVERPQESSSNESNILISVTSTPQCDSKNNSDLLAIHSDDSTDIDTHSIASELDIAPMEQDNTAVHDAPEAQKELSVAESPDRRNTESMENAIKSPSEDSGSDEKPLNDMIASPAKTVDATPGADNDSEITLNQDQLDNVDVATVQLPTIDAQDKNEDQNSMDFDDDALQSEANTDDIAMVDENSANVDDDTSPTMSPAVSPVLSSIVTPNVTPDSSPVRAIFKSPAPTEELDDSIESKLTEESQPITSTSSIELESVPKVLADENSTAASCSSDSEEQSLMGFSEMDTILANNQLERKEITEETKPACNSAKKSKPSEEVESDIQSDLIKDFKPPIDEISPTKDATYGIVAVPKNTDPNVHCQNATYQTRCKICNQFDPRIVKHYQIMHPGCDFFISRPAPHTIERMLNKSGCKILKDGKITAYCSFCDKMEAMPEMEWRQHLLAHTGELEFYCTECRLHWTKKMQPGGCAIDKTVNIFDQGEDGEIMMFMCKWCNYIQVRKSRIIRHLSLFRATEIIFIKNNEKNLY